MQTVKVFNSGKGQVIRILKEFMFDTNEVFINRVGDAVILTPVNKAKEIFRTEVGGNGMKCVQCGSENVVEGKLSTGLGGLVFTTEKAQKSLPFTKNYSVLTAKGCKDCGAVFDLRMVNPENIHTEA